MHIFHIPIFRPALIFVKCFMLIWQNKLRKNDHKKCELVYHPFITIYNNSFSTAAVILVFLNRVLKGLFTNKDSEMKE